MAGFPQCVYPGQFRCHEPSPTKVFQDVTGKALTYLNGINLGRRIWNLDQAIWILQDRHRNRVVFADYLYTQPGAIRDGQWDYEENSGNHFDRYKFEDFKIGATDFKDGIRPRGGPPLNPLVLRRLPMN